MKFKFKSLVVASAFVAAGAAHAAETLTLQTGASITSQGYTVSGLSGVGALAFSGSTGINDPAGGNLIDALNLGAALVTPEAPANVTIVGGVGTYTDITAGAPIQSVTGSFDGTTLNVLRVGTLGGATQTLNADNPDVSTGGFVTIKNLQVDLVNNDIYADVIGGNGVGLVSGLKLWHVGSVTGPTSFTAAEVLAAGGTITVKNTLSNLTIYDDAFNVFTKAAGLVDVLGIPALKTVNDSQFGYGTITSSITVSVKAAAAVPEPSTYALMGLGLVGMAFLRRRAAK